jgi:hypothetical protein
MHSQETGGAARRRSNLPGHKTATVLAPALLAATVAAASAGAETLSISTGHSVSATFNNVPATAHSIQWTNGNAEFTQLTIRINGETYRVFPQSANAVNRTTSIDASSVMTGPNNTVTFIGRGPIGSSANIVVGDAPLAAGGASTAAKGAVENTSISGTLADLTEDNTFDQLAIAAKEQIQLRLATSLDLVSAFNASNYVVTINGSRVSYLQASATPNADGTEVVLRLSTRSFATGDAIQVNWNGLKTTKGQLLSGHVDLVAE